MKNFTRSLCAVFILVLSLYSNSAQASHFKGGDTYFLCLGGGQYQLVFACYYACEPNSIPYDSIPADFSWTVSSTCGTVPTFIPGATATSAVDVPFYCPGVLTQCDYRPYSNAPAGTPTGTLLVVYTSAPFSIPAGCTVTATIENGSRNGAISNLQSPGSTDINIQATVTAPLDGSCNYNPVFAQYPVNVFCLGQNANFSQGAIDLNGDSLTYHLINPRDIGGAAIPFVSGCTPTNPMGVGSANAFASVFSFDTTTGNVNFTPTATGDYVLTVQVNAYHNGVLVGTTMRDIQFTVVTCTAVNNPPKLIHEFTTADVIGATVIDSTHIGVCPGELVHINLTSVDPDLNNYTIDSTNVTQSLPGSTVSVTHSGTARDTATLHITWTPGITDSGFHYFLVSLRDTFCPTPGRNTYAFVVSVLSGLYAGPNLVYCNGGQPVLIQAHGANHYLWTDSATGGPPVGLVSYAPDSSYIIVAPPVSAGYIVHGDLLGSCKNIDTVSVKNAPIFSLTAVAQDPSICKYTTTRVTTTPTPASVGPFTYSWSPAASLVSPTSASTATKPLTANTEFYVTVTAAGGCAIRDSTHVAINGAAPRIAIVPSTNNVCPGDTIQLTSSVFAENLVNCGLVDTCVANNILQSKAVPNDTSSSTGSNGFTNINCSPFMGSYNHYKVQYLFTKAELNAAGISSGTITDISFFVKQVLSSVGYDTFTVSMGCTNVDSLTTFVTGLQEVLPAQIGPNAITPNQGWTPLIFTHFYGWDGSSNLVIQICYTLNSSNNGNDDFVAYTTTPYTGSTLMAADYNFAGTNVSGCALDNSANIFQRLNTRPSVKFGMCVPDVLTYQWTPSTLLCNTCPNTAAIVTADSTYHLTVSDGICTNDTSVRLLLNRNLATHAIPDTTICGGDSVQLHVLLTNPPVSQCVQGYTVSSIPYSVIAGTVTAIGPVDFVNANGFTCSTDNGTAGPYAIGFNFPFYCQTFSQFYVNSNGWISFQNPYPATTFTQEYTAQTLPPSPGDLNPQKVIELLMGDYYLADGFGNGGGNVRYLVSGTGPNRILVVKFNNMADVSLSYTTTGEIHLYESTGVIEILIKSSNYTGTNHTTGIKDSTGLGIAAPGRNNQPYTISNTTHEAWRFTPQYGSGVAVNSSIWTPNTFINHDSVTNPIVYPPSTQTYIANTTVLINQFTSPSLCHVRDTVKVNIANFSHTLTARPTAICPGDTAHITFDPLGTTVSSYLWTPATGLSSTVIATPDASVLDTTKYYVTATDNHGCKVKDSITIDLLPVSHPQIGPSATICYSDSLVLSLTGAYTNFQWFSVDTATGARTPIAGANTGSLTAHPSGSYVLKATSASNTCPLYTNVVYVDSFHRTPIAVTPDGPTGFCIGGNVVLQAAQGLTGLQWTPASYGSQLSFPVSASGVFSYTGRDVHGCLLYSDTVQVTASPVPQITYNHYHNPFCPGTLDTIIATVTPSGALVSWLYNGAQSSGDTIVATASGTYYLIADLYGCTVGDSSVVLNSVPAPVVSLQPDFATCNDTTITALATSGTPGYTYLWSDSSTGSSTYDSQTGSKSFTVTVTDANQCTAVSNVQVVTINHPIAQIAIAPTDSVFAHDSITLTAIVPAGSSYSYQWLAFDSARLQNPTASSTAIFGGTAGRDTIRLIVTDPATGCSYTVDSIIIVVEFGAFKMPTAFSPNGDGVNDRFYAVFNGPHSPAHVTAFRIYDRWGQLVYDNPNAPGWDGFYAGNPQASDTYLYFVTVEYPDPSNAAKTIQQSVEGSFQLLR